MGTGHASSEGKTRGAVPSPTFDSPVRTSPTEDKRSRISLKGVPSKQSGFALRLRALQGRGVNIRRSIDHYGVILN